MSPGVKWGRFRAFHFDLRIKTTLAFALALALVLAGRAAEPRAVGDGAIITPTDFASGYAKRWVEKRDLIFNYRNFVLVATWLANQPMDQNVQNTFMNYNVLIKVEARLFNEHIIVWKRGRGVKIPSPYLLLLEQIICTLHTCSEELFNDGYL